MSDPVHTDLKVLVDVVTTLPNEYRQVLAGPMKQLNDNLMRKKRILQLVQEALDQLRLDMKYLMFDLEATRRERDNYKRKAEEK